MAFEAAIPISPRRADAHHGQEATSSTNRSDIRAQSHLGARDVSRSCYPRVVASIPTPAAKPAARSTAVPWIIPQITPIRSPPPSLAYREESIYALRLLVPMNR